jgi:ectoine hydroxylase-related dioxygenase (phytanoyl-CoA dioxygenase family)
MIETLRNATNQLLSLQSAQARTALRSQGSMIGVTAELADPVFAELITWQPALEALRAMGFEGPTFTDGYVISKPPKSPRLFWHYDWFQWDDQTSYRPEPLQVFFMYYLHDTNPANGCLRVIPGSHVRHNALHDVLAEPHSKQLSEVHNERDPAFSTRPDEVDISVRAGDLLIGDARLLHATHTNTTDSCRTVITLWYQPELASLTPGIQAHMAAKTQHPPASWPAAAREKVAAIQPKCEPRRHPRILYRRRQEEILL